MKKIVITGAGAGIGYAITKQCLADGFIVIACDNDLKALQKLQAEFAENIRTYNFDIADYDQVQNFFSQMEKNDWPQFLVNNAGIYLAKNILDYTPLEIQQVMNININGAMYMTKFFARHLMEHQQSGAIVNMSSVAQYGGSDAIYGASKGALAAFTRCCAMNFSPYIRVNAVAPGIISDTAMYANLPVPVLKWYQETELVKEPLQATDVAKTVLFLLSDNAAHYTGATFDLNNGFHRH